MTSSPARLIEWRAVALALNEQPETQAAEALSRTEQIPATAMPNATGSSRKPLARTPISSPFTVPRGVPEKERDRIAQRTDGAPAAAAPPAARPSKIGERNRAAADTHAETLRTIVAPPAKLSTGTIAKILNDLGITTPRGGHWQSPQVMRLLDRLGLSHG